ncbi:XPO5 isoform 5, partial [Pongo abelii]
LSQKWQVINQRSLLCGEDEAADENPESQEMLEEQLRFAVFQRRVLTTVVLPQQMETMKK